MVTASVQEILSKAQSSGWVLEPDAKAILAEAGLTVPRFRFAESLAATLQAGAQIGYPLVAKVVSPRAMHKSERGGVIVGIADREHLARAYEHFSGFEEFRGVHVEELVTGLELIIGAKVDYQFGPVVILGMGGTGVEIYQDTAIRMAPLTRTDVLSMADSLKGRPWMDGYRGQQPIDMAQLVHTMLRFSELVMDLAERIASIDLNPVMATPQACIVADARIILAGVKP